MPKKSDLEFRRAALGAAAEGLAKTPYPPNEVVKDRMIKIMQEDKDPLTKAQILLPFMENFPTTETLFVVVEGLKDSSPEVRNQAKEILRKYHPTDYNLIPTINAIDPTVVNWPH